MRQGTYATRIATYNKQTRESTNFYTKSPSQNRIFLYKLFPIENRPNFWFLGGPRSKIMKKYLFLSIYVFFGAESPRTNTWKIGSLKNVNFNLLSFKRCPYDNDSWPSSLGDLNVILGAWNDFSGKCCKTCDQPFSLN